MKSLKKPKIPAIVPKTDVVPEGYIIDFLTQRMVKDNPEEYIRQNIEKALVKQYNYSANDCAPEFRIKMGSKKPRVDIIVFEPGSKHLQENAYILSETKRAGTSPKNKKEGIDQLKSYMAACLNAKFGLWTNGDDRFCFVKQQKGKKIEFNEIVDIPSAGDTGDEAERPKRQDLKAATADNLLFAFRRCHNYIAGAEGHQKPDAFWELLKIIFCKIEDERSNKIDFYSTTKEIVSATAAAPVKARIQNIFKNKVIKRYGKIFLQKDHIIYLKPNVIAFVVAQLQRYSLLASPVDVKGIAYEEIVGSNLRGDRGEFFTPRNACRMAVKILDPQPFERIIDPACGTGGFLITAMNHALEELHKQESTNWDNSKEPSQIEQAEFYRKRNEYLSNCVFASDLNPSLVRASKMNMVLNNDGEGNLYQANSLENHHKWDKELTKNVSLGSMDILFTNPPFGTKIVIDDEEILSQYDLAAMWDKNDNGEWNIRNGPSNNRVLQKSQPPEILFIERCLQFLKEGEGRMAMVIPNGILNIPALGYVRQWIRENAQIIAVIDMARDLFQPKNDTQTSMVFLRRFSKKERQLARERKMDYPIFMAVTLKIGHDKRGKAIYRQAPNGDDLLLTRKEEVTVLNPAINKLEKKIKEVKDKVIDDELPEAADAYLRWLENQ